MTSLVRRMLAGPSAPVQRALPLGYDESDLSFVVPGGRQYSGIPNELPSRGERVDANFVGLAQGALRGNGVVFSIERFRIGVFSEARFQYRRYVDGRPQPLFGDQSLSILERPWPGATTRDLLAQMLLHADLAGTAYVARRPNGRLRLMRPDWVVIIVGLPDDPDGGPMDLDAEVLGYVYWPGGFASKRDAVYLLPEEVAAFWWNPDPVSPFKGSSWLSAMLPEVEADTAATEHKRQFFRNGATLQYVVTFDRGVPRARAEAAVKSMTEQHTGARNAYRTLYLGAGADVKTIGTDLRQLDFKATQGAGETRLAAAGGIHPVLLPLSEGLSGSSLNEGNYRAARENAADTTFRPLWGNAAAALERLVDLPPDGAELAVDLRDVAFVREDAQKLAAVGEARARTIRTLVDGGFTWESVIAAVASDDETRLVHSGMLSVQLQSPGSSSAGPAGAGDAAVPADEARARSLVEMVQKVYLGVNVVITPEEARAMLNQAGAGLVGPGPVKPPAPAVPAFNGGVPRV